jgi:predicted SnoaL-like aldol condensation-catalyzing enzyme
MRRTFVALLATAMIGAGSPTMAGTMPGDGSPALEKNKATVVAFYDKALNQKDIDGALEYVGEHYKQHNPTAEDDREGFRKFITWIRGDHPQSHSEIKQVFADGDFVILNVHMVRHPGERGLAIAEIFRLEGGKIVEHWDRIQPVPETAKNNNTMF